MLLLYLEDHIGDPAGYDTVAQELERAFGAKLYRSAGGKCSPKLPLTLNRNKLLLQGVQVVAVASGCGGGTEQAGATPWSTMAFDWSGDVHGESRPRGYEDFPKCGSDFDRAKYQRQIVRYFEDSTFVTSSTSSAGAAGSDDGITPQTAAAMARCGVDLFGLDQLLPDDGRLESLVWSWAKGEPSRPPLRGAAALRRTLGGDALHRQSAPRPAASATAAGSSRGSAVTYRRRRVPAASAAPGWPCRARATRTSSCATPRRSPRRARRRGSATA